MEEYNDKLQQQLEEAQEEIKEKDNAIARFAEGTAKTQETLATLEARKLELEKRLIALEEQTAKVRRGRKMSEAVLEILRRNARPMTTKEIADALIQFDKSSDVSF